MKKKIVALCLCVALLAVAVIGGTLAYFTDTATATNTFTSGKVDITLSETDHDGSPFVSGQKLLPGSNTNNAIAKNAVVKVEAGSEDSYVWVEILIPTELYVGADENHEHNNALHYNQFMNYLQGYDTDSTNPNAVQCAKLYPSDHQWSLMKYIDEVPIGNVTYGTDSPYAAWSTCGHNNAPAAAGSAPSISKYTLTFANGSTLIANDLYTAGEQDVTFTPTLTSVKLSNGAALAGTDLSVTKQDAFTVHINRFDLIITKAWTGPSTYKQDAIFTVGRDDTRESFQLVIPKNESSITVTGLFCGHSYTVTEEGNWSWRYRASGDGDVSCDGHDISRTPPAAHSVGTSFTNTLSNNRWLNGSAYCPNKFTTVLNAAQSAVSGLLNLFRKKEG